LYGSQDRLFIGAVTQRKMSSASLVPPVRDMRNAYRILAGNPERKRPFRRFKTLRQDIIKMYLK
jgi:hypothetical protein